MCDIRVKIVKYDPSRPQKCYECDSAIWGKAISSYWYKYESGTPAQICWSCRRWNEYCIFCNVPAEKHPNMNQDWVQFVKTFPQKYFD